MREKSDFPTVERILDSGEQKIIHQISNTKVKSLNFVVPERIAIERNDKMTLMSLNNAAIE